MVLGELSAHSKMYCKYLFLYKCYANSSSIIIL